jgi:hypothetical protein
MLIFLGGVWMTYLLVTVRNKVTHYYCAVVYLHFLCSVVSVFIKLGALTFGVYVYNCYIISMDCSFY